MEDQQKSQHISRAPNLATAPDMSLSRQLSFFLKTSYKFILHSRGIHIPNASSKYSILSKSKTDIKSVSLVQINPVIVILNILSLFTFSLCRAFIKFKVVIQRSRTKIILISTEEIILNPSRDFSI